MRHRVCVYPRVTSIGGVGSFLFKFTGRLVERGVEVSYDLNDRSGEVILVLGGTHKLLGLWQAKRRGVPIVQRLDGINWVQRRRWTGLRYLLRAEYGNANLAFIRSFLADRIVYQSEFTHHWWEDWYGLTHRPWRVIRNGVDLNVYTPSGPHDRPVDRYRLLVVEGNLTGGLDLGLRIAVQLAERLIEKHPLELMIAGGVDAGTQARLQRHSRVPICFLGVVPRERIPEIDRSAHLCFSAEVNPPCPNAVIEALACGLPVIGFDTGSLTELVTGDAGRLVPYGKNPWNLDPPDITQLAEAAEEVLSGLPRFRNAARKRAVEVFGLDKMVDEYLQVLLG